MVVGFVGIWCIVGFVEVEFVVVHVPTNSHVLTKSASSEKTVYSQLYQLCLDFGPRARGVACLR